VLFGGFRITGLHVIGADRDGDFLALVGINDGQTIKFDFGHHALLLNDTPDIMASLVRGNTAMSESEQDQGAKVAKVIASIIIAGILLMIGYALLPWIVHG